MLVKIKGYYISISSFTVNVTDYCRFHGTVAGHITFATLGLAVVMFHFDLLLPFTNICDLLHFETKKK
jgi:hypothetical protein